jgi:hypothetical protein
VQRMLGSQKLGIGSVGTKLLKHEVKIWEITSVTTAESNAINFLKGHEFHDCTHLVAAVSQILKS